ncbi:pyridoxamine 5'-phosphate oxidase family protein [Maritimibacter sp. DP1N21-5]|uniref:pyridoxamine 5'-phosphate oxidase family protein n=1 Tax=Maritimibacter sp. DP1N21-5 TaxID=2836867 RepID=UPI001C487943|nr:pyridoxamine 5'-phosphate oxidase family protein [Maritimibacter sp. DP1N21-5]MBV7409157.1 pyridoxamine 5'-phosphate oxidase family protein [Maritimibacter sp. DP1N21-5]
MSDLKKAKTNPQEVFWGTVKDTRFGMLSVADNAQHPQPMTHFVDEDARALWFLTSKDTDLARALAGPKQAWFTVTTKGQDVQISVKGLLEQVQDPAKVEELWNPVVGAWFDDKDDPKIALLRLSLDNAAIWASTDSSFVFAWEIAKAHAKDEEPDVGTHTIVTF